MRKNIETSKHPLRSGITCLSHKCILCCIETGMPLSPLDMDRISKLGYWRDDFAVSTINGWQLKNLSGRCVFLAGNGCSIYPNRPEGCRLYPLVYDEDLRQSALDELCPHRYEFKITPSDHRKLKSLLERLRKDGEVT